MPLSFDPDTPVTLNSFKGNDGIVTVDLGTNPDNGLSYSLFATIQPMPMGIPAASEFIFWIADYDPETHVIGKIWDGRATKHVIAGHDRKFVLYLVCEALERLVKLFSPSTIFYQSCEPDIPDKALEKYHIIGHRLEELGYKFWRLAPYHGYEAWKAELLAIE